MEADGTTAGAGEKSGEQWLHDSTGIPMAVIQRMDGADDWTFVITLHAMIEAVLNNLITHKLGHPELSEIISRFETGDRQRGKLAWAKTLGLLSEQSRSFIRVISELRNVLVHNISEFDFSLQKWILEMNPKSFKNFMDSFSKELADPMQIQDQFLPLEEALKQHPKVVIFSAACVIIIHANHLCLISAEPHQSTPKE
jgi:hypothetical protein